MQKLLDILVTLVFAAAVGWTGYLTLQAVLPEKPEPMPTSAVIACPVGSDFTFGRTSDETLTVTCIIKPLEVPKVEVHAASTPPYEL